jgi:hypothetical protein
MKTLLFLMLLIYCQACSGWTAKRTPIAWPCAGSGCSPLFGEAKR